VGRIGSARAWTIAQNKATAWNSFLIFREAMKHRDSGQSVTREDRAPHLC